ncbi:MAG: hypothetical protein RIR18_858, partial [Pseudomonadota bacterium]
MPFLDLLQFDPAWGLAGLGLFSFLSATILPGGSEAFLLLFLSAQPEAPLLAVLVSTAGNTAGGMTSWWCGFKLPRWQKLERFPHLNRLQRWGSPALLLAWLPIVGDALCVAAGWFRLHWLPCLTFMAIGKGVRY